MLGIAIINYNTFEKTVECINSVFDTVKTEYKIYLIDNASQNNSFEELERLYGSDSRVELVKSEENLGYARGNNACLERAKRDGCDYVLISNNDIVFKENSVASLLKKAKSTGAMITAPHIVNPDGSTQNSVKSRKPTFKEYLRFSNYIISNFVGKKATLKYCREMFPKAEAEVYWVSGACFLADMKQFEEIGFFDSYTFLYFEEYIIAEKAQKSGKKIIYCPDAEVFHHHGASTGGSANLFTRLASFKSEAYMFSNYWVITKGELKLIRLIRCLEVIWSFFKAKKPKEALQYIKESKKILKETPRK